MLNWNYLVDHMNEIGLHGWSCIERYIAVSRHELDIAFRNHNDRIALKEREVMDAMLPFCNDHDIRLNELIHVLDEEAKRRNYVKKMRIQKGGAA